MTNDELNEIAERADALFTDVLKNIGGMVLQDYGNLNELGLLLRKWKREKDAPAPAPIAQAQGDEAWISKSEELLGDKFEADFWIRSTDVRAYLASRPSAPVAQEAERYRWLRRRVAIIGKASGAAFEFVNLPYPTCIAPDPARGLDAAIDTALEESRGN